MSGETATLQLILGELRSLLSRMDKLGEEMRECNRRFDEQDIQYKWVLEYARYLQVQGKLPKPLDGFGPDVPHPHPPPPPSEVVATALPSVDMKRVLPPFVPDQEEGRPKTPTTPPTMPAAGQPAVPAKGQPAVPVVDQQAVPAKGQPAVPVADQQTSPAAQHPSLQPAISAAGQPALPASGRAEVAGAGRATSLRTAEAKMVQTADQPALPAAGEAKVAVAGQPAAPRSSEAKVAGAGQDTKGEATNGQATVDDGEPLNDLQLMWAFQRGAKMLDRTRESAVGLLQQHDPDEKEEKLDLVLDCVAFKTKGERFETQVRVSSSFLVLAVRKIIILKLFRKEEIFQFGDQLYKAAEGTPIPRYTNLVEADRHLHALNDKHSLREIGVKSGDTVYLRLDGLVSHPNGEYAYVFSSLVASSLLSGAITHDAIRKRIEQRTGIPVTTEIIECSVSLLNKAQLLKPAEPNNPAVQLRPELHPQHIGPSPPHG